MTDFEKFEALIKKWREAYTYAIFTYVEVKTFDEGHKLLAGNVLLSSVRDVNKYPDLDFKTENLVIARFARPVTASDLDKIIKDAEAGKMECLEGEISLRKGSDRFNHYLDSIRYPFGLKLAIRGVDKHSLLVAARSLREPELELKTSAIPFENLEELLGCHAPLLSLRQNGGYTALEVIAECPGFLSETSTIAEGQAVIEIRRSKILKPDKLLLGYRSIKNDEVVDRASVKGDVFNWHEEADWAVGTHRILINDSARLQTYLSYDGSLIDERLITDPERHPNPRRIIQQTFDSDLNVLRKLLLTPKDDFENPVSTLFTLLGFSCLLLGQIPKLQDGPDIIAITSSGHVAMIECTIGILNNKDKLPKLVQRCGMLKERLGLSGYGHLLIQPVIVSCLPREQAAPDIETAVKYQIAVVCKSELEDLLNQVALKPSADEVFKKLRKSVPRGDSTAFFPLESEP